MREGLGKHVRRIEYLATNQRVVALAYLHGVQVVANARSGF